MKILNTAHKDLVLNLTARSHTSIKLCAPFIKEESMQWILDSMCGKASLQLITKITLGNFYQGGSDISALEAAYKKNCSIYNVQNLHAKFYIFDDEHAIITSANITQSGLKYNFEYGIYITEKDLVQQICGDFNMLSKKNTTATISDKTIDIIKKLLSKMPPKKTHSERYQGLHQGEDCDVLIDKELITHNTQLTGWKRAVFDALCTVDKQTFTTHDYTSLLPTLQQKYPTNHYTEEKFRQILQQLRDIGLIKFEGNGVYTKLWA